MKNTVKKESAAPRALVHVRTKFQLARIYDCVLGSNFLFDNLSLASKLSSVERETLRLEPSLDIAKLATLSFSRCLIRPS
jgi:hypothetical protein